MSISNDQDQASPETQQGPSPAANGQEPGEIGGCANSGEVLTARSGPRDTRRFDLVAELYSRWLPSGDNFPIPAVLTTYAATRWLTGPPPWTVLVGPPGCGKTEHVLPLAGLPAAVMADEISGPAALLPFRPIISDIENEPTGGLLNKIGNNGMLVIKDMTSILTLSRDKRAQLFSALRQIYDGDYRRDLGAPGGISVSWAGRMGFIGCVTPVIDRAYGVISELGTRWLYIRFRPTIDPLDMAYAAIDNLGHEHRMQLELKSAVHDLLTNPQPPYPVDDAREQIQNLSVLVSLARSPILYDDTAGKIVISEKVGRVIKQLTQLYRAAGVIGMPEPMAREMIARIGLDSVPRLRGLVLAALIPYTEQATSDIVGKLAQPHTSVQRTLDELQAHGLVTRNTAGQGRLAYWGLSDAARGWLVRSGLSATYPELAQPPISLARTAPRSPGGRSRRDQRARQRTAQGSPWGSAQ